MIKKGSFDAFLAASNTLKMLFMMFDDNIDKNEWSRSFIGWPTSC